MLGIRSSLGILRVFVPRSHNTTLFVNLRRQLVIRDAFKRQLLPVHAITSEKHPILIQIRDAPHLPPDFDPDLAHLPPDIPPGTDTDDGGDGPDDIRDEMAGLCC